MFYANMIKPLLRRAVIWAELDTYYARLYGLTRDARRYIFDPVYVRVPITPSKPSVSLKNNELKTFGEYRTPRLVLEAWDKMEDA